MKFTYKLAAITITALLVSACGEKWTCQTKGKSMFSMSESGKIGSADKGCSCEQIRAFELREFGEVDEQALQRDFGC